MLISLHKYSNQEIMKRKDELAVLLLIDKLSDISDFHKLREEVSPEYFTHVTENTSQNVMDIMVSVIRVFLSKLKLSEEEIEEFMERIKEEDNVGGWFEHFKEIDLPAERRKMREEVEKEVREEVEKEVREEVEKEVREEVEKEVREEVREEVEKEVQQEDIKIFIDTLKELNVSRDFVEDKLKERYYMTVEEIEENLDRYW